LAVPYHLHAAGDTVAPSIVTEAHLMAATTVPHFANDAGAERIFIGVREFQCMGARAPFDHPHVYLDMGQDTQILCPYCSTLYVHDPRLSATESDPKGCRVADAA
jgi:uncharacterized Zn-finger protein